MDAGPSQIPNSAMQELQVISRAQLPFVEEVIVQILDWRNNGLRAALITLVDVEGSGPRQIGSQMAVNERGDCIGQITSGCAESALIAEALLAIRQGTARLERYGAGSKYLDIQLPCGSGIDVYFDPHVPLPILDGLAVGLAARRPVSLVFRLGSEHPDDYRIAPLAVSGPEDERRRRRHLRVDDQRFVRPYVPAIQLVIAGGGHELLALAGIAKTLGWPVIASSPDESVLEQLRPLINETHHLVAPDHFDAQPLDPWSAGVVLFHDHDWDPPILAAMLNSEAFYIGALGSRATHQTRCRALGDLGFIAPQIDKIRGPIGLDIGARNPPEIALSIAGEVLAAAHGNRWATRDE